MITDLNRCSKGKARNGGGHEEICYTARQLSKLTAFANSVGSRFGVGFRYNTRYFDVISPPPLPPRYVKLYPLENA